MQRRELAMIGVAGLALMTLGGCGGSGSTTAPSGAVSALTVADKVSVVEAKSDGGTSQIGRLLAGVTFAPTTDYEKDATTSYVQDRSTEAFNTVNEILCMVGQTRYDQMVNKGPYKVLVNNKLCSGNDSADNAGASMQAGTSGAEAPDYNNWTVEVTRANNSSPQYVKVWVHEKARQGQGWSEPEKLIKAEMEITKSAAEQPPYGLFTINFAGYPATNGVPNDPTTPAFKGVLKSVLENGKVTLKFIESDQNNSGNGKAVAMVKDSATSGQGIARLTESFGGGDPQTLSIKFNYNSNLFHRANAADINNSTCLDRVNFETSAWRYGMYDANGARVNLASGFPINTAADGRGQNGWVGFWGMWLPDTATVTNNTVYKMNYGPNAAAPTPYTVLTVGGKLKKFKKFNTTLGNIKNIPLEGYSEPDPNTQGQMLNFRVKWDGSQLMKVAYHVQGQNMSGPPTWNEYPTPIAIDPTKLQWGELNFWSQALGGQVRVKLSGCSYNNGVTSCTAPTAETPVAYFVENIVYPGEPVPALACYDNCPQVDELGNVSNIQGNNTPNHYTFASNVLKNAQNASLLQTGSGGQSWGFNSGPLFNAAIIADPATSPLKCEWSTEQNPQICGWKAWSELNEFYTWETGKNNWNKLTVLTDGQGNALRFEQPMKVEYTHNKAPYLGTKFYLDYNGFGELQGIPGKCVDMNDGSPVDCSQGGSKPVRWVPEFSIPKDTQVTYTRFNKDTGSSSTATGYVKPLEMEQRMTKLTAPGACGALPLTSTMSLPNMTEWSKPDIGTEPVVTAAPAVIAGVVQ